LKTDRQTGFNTSDRRLIRVPKELIDQVPARTHKGWFEDLDRVLRAGGLNKRDRAEMQMS
jgi:hypothetical protein